jgi:manganese/iron transport system ATP-binding protein
LVIEQLDVDLAGRQVLRDVELRVDPGELVGLLGPNGAGKTTLLRAVLGLVAVRSGRVQIDGGSARAARHRLGYVPQRHEFAWDFPTSVELAVMSGRTGLLGLWRRPGVADWVAVGDALERVQLSDLRTRPVGELSGGQRQRVLVARALATAPGVLLLDEPYTGLDMPTQELLGRLFRELADEGRAVLMTTHDLLGARHDCSRLVLLAGTVIAQGTPEQLRDPAPWMATFGIGPQHPVLRILEVS